MSDFIKEDQERAVAVVETIWRELQASSGDFLYGLEDFVRQRLYDQVPFLKDVFVEVRGG